VYDRDDEKTDVPIAKHACVVSAGSLTECVFAKAETDPESLDARHKGYNKCQTQHTGVAAAGDDRASWVGFVELK